MLPTNHFETPSQKTFFLSSLQPFNTRVSPEANFGRNDDGVRKGARHMALQRFLHDVRSKSRQIDNE